MMEEPNFNEEVSDYSIADTSSGRIYINPDGTLL